MPSRNRGFTIAELMIVVALMGILLAIGVPSFRQFILNQKIRALSESMLNGLQLARATAVQRNEPVEFRLGMSGPIYDRSWSIVATATSGTVIQSRPSGDSSDVLTVTVTPASATTVTFNGMGRVVATNADGSSPLQSINIDVPSTVMSNAESADLSVRVLPGGLIKLCDPNIASSSTDVRKCP